MRKTATASIEAVLAPYHDGDDFMLSLEEALSGRGDNPKHARPVRLKSLVPANVWDEYFKFVFVRNPWGWVASQSRFARFKEKRLPFYRQKIRKKDVEKVWERLKSFAGRF